MSTDRHRPLNVLLVEDNDEVANDLVPRLAAAFDLPVQRWPNCEDCRQALGWDDSGVIFIDWEILPVETRMQGNRLLERLVAWRSPLVAVIISGRPGSQKMLVEEAFKLGINNRGHCIAYLGKPLYADEMLAAATRALQYAAIWAPRKQRERLMIQALLDRITPAELFVMECVLKGYSSSIIAEVQWEIMQREPGTDRVRRPPAGPSPSAAADDDEDDDADLADEDPQMKKARFITRRTHVVDFQRFYINNNDERLAPLGLRIDDFEVLLDDRFDALLPLMNAEIEMRLGLLSPQQRDALAAARPLGNKAPRTPVLTEALQRIRAADVRAVNKWYAKTEHLKKLCWVWPAKHGTSIATPP